MIILWTNFLCIDVFVGPTYNKPKKQFKTKFYKQINNLKQKDLEIEWNLEKKTYKKWNWNLTKSLTLLHLHKL
jgi:hypothetical protein